MYCFAHIERVVEMSSSGFCKLPELISEMQISERMMMMMEKYTHTIKAEKKASFPIYGLCLHL